MRTLASSGRKGNGRFALFGQRPHPCCGICSSSESRDMDRIFAATRSASPLPAGPAQPSGRAASGVCDVQRGLSRDERAARQKVSAQLCCSGRTIPSVATRYETKACISTLIKVGQGLGCRVQGFRV